MQVDELLPLKNKLDELRKRVKEFKRAIIDVLNNDEDMDLIIALPTATTTIANTDETDGTFYSEQNPTTDRPNSEVMNGMKSVDHRDLEMLLENYLNEVIIMSIWMDTYEASHAHMYIYIYIYIYMYMYV